jgi:hypothetical protein
MPKSKNDFTSGLGDSAEESYNADSVYDLPIFESKSEALAIMANEGIRVGALIWKPTGLIVDGDVTREDWEQTGKLLKQLTTSMQWLIGDWVLAAEELSYGDREAFAANIGFSVKTIYEYSYVARNVEFSIRMENLDFGHHQLVAGMDSQEEQLRWLQAAAEGDNGKRWSIARLRQEIEAEKLGRSASVPPRTLWYRASARERDRVRKAFERSKKKGNAFELKNHIEFAKEQGQYWQKFAQELEEEIKKGITNGSK